MNAIKNNQKLTRRKQIIDLINHNVSIPRISKELNVAKSTIYYHYQKIKGKKTRPVRIPEDGKILGEFLGAFAGDGGFFYDKKHGHYTITLHFHAIDDKEYAVYMKNLLEKHFNKKTRFYLKPPKGLVLVFYSKDIYHILFEYFGVRGAKTEKLLLKKDISLLSDEFKTHFIRGLVDTDGHVNKSGQVILCLIAKKLILQVSEMLNSLGIENTVRLRKKAFHWHDQAVLTIRKKPAVKYLEIVGFSNKRKEKNICAGRDSNSRS